MWWLTALTGSKCWMRGQIILTAWNSVSQIPVSSRDGGQFCPAGVDAGQMFPPLQWAISFWVLVLNWWWVVLNCASKDVMPHFAWHPSPFPLIARRPTHCMQILVLFCYLLSSLFKIFMGSFSWALWDLHAKTKQCKIAIKHKIYGEQWIH